MTESTITIGILGDGQLARMSALAAHDLGISVRILTRSFNSSAAQVLPNKNCLLYEEQNFASACMELAEQCELLTLENEFFSASMLSDVVEESKIQLYPSVNLFSAIEDKIRERQYFRRLGFPMTEALEIKTIEDLGKELPQIHGNGLFLKVSKGAYDGKGTFFFSEPKKALEKAREIVGHQRECLIEPALQIECELSQIVVCNEKAVKRYPLLKTHQQDQVCVAVESQVKGVPEAIEQKIQQLSLEFAQSTQTRGVFALEFFFTSEGELFFNEVAPRPHNSGHLTQNAHETSQFENHIRAICGLPLGNTSLVCDKAVMLNLFGRHLDKAWDKLRDYHSPSVHPPRPFLHLYGKKALSENRKVGHLNILFNQNQKYTIDSLRASWGTL